MVDAASLVASTDLRLSVLRYTLLFEWLGVERAKKPGKKSLQSFSSFNQTVLLFFLHMHGQTYALAPAMHTWKDVYGRVALYPTDDTQT